MKVKQFIGPFSTDTTLSLDLNNATYVRIGLERPMNTPITESAFLIPIMINNKTYSIGFNDILEFSDLSLTTLSITVLTVDENINTDYFIIDIAYE